MKVGDLVKITDEDKIGWAKHNPWMAIAWGLDDTWLIVGRARRSTGFLWKLRNLRTNEELCCKTGDVEVISESR